MIKSSGTARSCHGQGVVLSRSQNRLSKFSCSAAKEHVADTSGWWKEGKDVWVDVSTAEEYQREVLDEPQKKVFIDWYATWCSGCKKAYPELSNLARDQKGNFKFVKCSLEDLPLIAKEQGKVKTLPAATIYYKGERLATFGVPTIKNAPGKAQPVHYNERSSWIKLHRGL